MNYFLKKIIYISHYEKPDRKQNKNKSIKIEVTFKIIRLVKFKKKNFKKFFFFLINYSIYNLFIKNSFS
jgi:hypothetical protein